MSVAAPWDFECLSAGDQALINDVCHRFAEALQVPGQSLTETWLEGVPEPLRQVALRELLLLECEHRWRRDGSVPAVELIQRFPEHRELIADAVEAARRYATLTVEDETIFPQPSGDNDVPPVDSLGRFRLKRVLGQGGAGVVYLAFDPHQGRDVALKVPHTPILLLPELRRRFLREADAARHLDHPGLVPILDIDEAGVFCYITTEYVPGQTLADWLEARREQGQPVPADAAARLVRTLAEAMQYAHDRGVLHCDLKPSNILLPEGAEGSPRVTDFGLARLISDKEEVTRTGQILGTPAYMAPEQVEGRRRDVTARTDVYALGVILYELVAGRPPFTGDSVVALLHRVLVEDAPRLRGARADVPRQLEAVCLKCLHKNPGRRYATAGHLADDLARFLAGAPTEARPPGLGERLARWARRHPVAATLLPLLAAALLAGFAALAYHAERLGMSNRELQAAVRDRDEGNALLALEKARAEEQARFHRRRVYADQMRRAQGFLDRNDLAGLERLLGEWEPAPGREDLRGFEWHLLRHQIDRHQFDRHQLAAFAVPDIVYSLRFTKDGGTLLLGGKDRAVRFLDPDTGRERRPALAHPGQVAQVTCSPDGQLLATACEDGKVRLWSPAGRLLRVWEGHERKIHAVAFSPDGSAVVSAAADGTARLWDVAQPGEPGRVLMRFSCQAQSAAFTPDGRRVLVGFEDGILRVSDPAAGGAELSMIGPLGGVSQLCFLAPGNGFVSGDRGGKLRLWEPLAGGGAPRWEERDRSSGNFDRLADLARSPDGQFLAVAFHGGVEVWSAKPLRRRCVLRGHGGRVWAACFHPNGQRLFTTGSDLRLRVWDWRGAVGDQTQTAVRGSTVYSLQVSPRGLLYVGSDRPALECWTPGGEEGYECTWEQVMSQSIVHLTRSGDRLLACGVNGQVWSQSLPASGTPDPRSPPSLLCTLAEPFPRRDEPDRAVDRRVTFDPAGRLLALTLDQTVHVWELPSGRLLRTITPPGSRIQSYAHGPDGMLATGSADGKVRLWDVETGELRQTLVERERWLHVMTLSPTGRLLAMGGVDGSAKLYDTRTGAEVARLEGHRDLVRALAFSPDEKTVATGSADGTLRLWQVTTGNEMLAAPEPDESVRVVTFSSDGRFLAAISEAPGKPGKVRVWDCGQSLPPPAE